MFLSAGGGESSMTFCYFMSRVERHTCSCPNKEIPSDESLVLSSLSPLLPIRAKKTLEKTYKHCPNACLKTVGAGSKSECDTGWAWAAAARGETRGLEPCLGCESAYVCA